MAKITRKQEMQSLYREMNYRDEHGRLRGATIENLRLLRKLTRTPPAELARALGVPRAFVSAWYADHYAPPFDKMELILKFLQDVIDNTE